MLQMFLPCLVENKSGIQVYHNNATHVFLKYIIDQPHKGGKSVGETKRHHHPLIKIEFGLKCSFLCTINMHPYLVIPNSEVYLGKIVSPLN